MVQQSAQRTSVATACDAALTFPEPGSQAVRPALAGRAPGPYLIGMLVLSEQRMQAELRRAAWAEAAARRARRQAVWAGAVCVALILFEMLLFGLSMHLTGSEVQYLYVAAQLSGALPALWLALWHITRRD